MENISKHEAAQALQYLGIVSKALVNENKDDAGSKNTLTSSLTKLDTTIKDLSTTLGSIFNLLKKSIETKFQTENKRRYNEEETTLENIKQDKPSISATKKEKLSDFTDSPILKAAIGAILYSMLPEDVKEKISTFTSGILSELGVTENQIKAIKNATEFISKSLLYFAGFKFGVLLAESLVSMVGAFVVFASRMGLKVPAQLAILGAGAVAGGAGLASVSREISDIERQFNKDIDDSKIERPDVSSLPRPGSAQINLQTPTSQLKETIAARESGGDYNIVFKGTNQFNTTPPEVAVGKRLTEMTIAEVINYQQNVLLPETRGRIGKGNLGTTAVGKYQFITPTLMKLASEAGYDFNTTKFTPAVQEKLADLDIEKIRKSSSNDEDFARRINKEWEGARVTAGNVKATTSNATSDLEKLKSQIDNDKDAIKKSISGSNTSGADVNKQSQENRANANKAPPQSSVNVSKNSTTKDDTSNLPDDTQIASTTTSTRPGNDKA